MSVHREGLLSSVTVSLLVLLCCVLTVFGEEVVTDEDGGEDALTRQRDTREYIPETWHAVQSTKEGTSGWIPRDSIDSRSAVASTKRRRLRKRKRRPPVVSFLDESIEEIMQPTNNFKEEKENVKQDRVVTPKNEITLSGRFFEEGEEFTPPKRRKRPNVREPWEELQEESIRPYVRRKVTPAYQSSDEIGIMTSSSATHQFSNPENKNQDTEQSHVYYGKPKKTNKKDPHNVEIKEIFRSSTTTKKTPNLKSILKQNGGLSLSEILQQKNLTLSELLAGNQEAIKALTDSSETTSTVNRHNSYSENFISSTQKSPSFSETYDDSKYKRLPPSVALKKENINRKYEQYGDSHEILSEIEMFEAQKKRQALLQGHNYKNAYNGKYAEVTRYEVITEPTTEKRIFVPSHPKLYTSVDYKPEFSELAHTEPYISVYRTSTTPKTTTEVITQKSTTAIHRATSEHTEVTLPAKVGKTTSTKSKLGLPITSAKLNKMTSKRVFPAKATFITETENYPSTASVPFTPIKINVKDVAGFLSSENQPEDKVSDEPFRMSIDLDTILDQPTSTKPSTEPSTTTISTSTETSSTPTSSTTQDTPKLKPFSAKDEILEILKDSEGRARLANILDARNMTIQELIDQRERGSSQLHLADIFHNKTKEPEPLEEAFEGQITSEVFTSFPVFIRQPKGLFKQEKSTEPPTETTSQSSKVVVTAFPSFKIEVPKNLPENFDKENQAFPWKELYPDLFNVQDKNTAENPVMLAAEIQEVGDNGIDQVQNRADILTQEDFQRLEDLDQRLFSSVSSEQLNIVDEDIHKIMKVPSGVQSAIIASLVIVGLSFVVFVTILIIFKWIQKRKPKVNYCDSLKPPLFDIKRKNIRTFVTETLGRTKFSYYRNNLSGTPDSVWERNEDGKASF